MQLELDTQIYQGSGWGGWERLQSNDFSCSTTGNDILRTGGSRVGRGRAAASGGGSAPSAHTACLPERGHRRNWQAWWAPRASRERAPPELASTADLSEAQPGLCRRNAELDVARRGPHSRSLISGEKQRAGRAADSSSCPQGPPGQKDQHEPGLWKEEEDEEVVAGGHPCLGCSRLGAWPACYQRRVGPVLWGEATLPRWDPAP